MRFDSNLACLAVVGLVFGVAACLSTPASVTELRVPEDGRMPQAAVDESGVIHLTYFRGAMTGGDLRYARRNPSATEWSTPVSVNSEPRAALGMGPMDGGDMALAQSPAGGHRLHAVWFLNTPFRLLYTQSDVGGGFAPQRIIWEGGDEVMEARPSLTTDPHGGVHVAWHGATREGADDAHRAVFLMSSRDEGTTFSPPTVVSRPSDGACGCCSLDAFADEHALFISFRGAGDNTARGQRLLTSTDGRAFDDQLLHPWEIGACPVTTTTFARGPDTVRVAWETAGEVYFAPVDRVGDHVTPEGQARFRRKNPAIATNRRGETIMAWGDAPGYRAGGTLQWQVFDEDGAALSALVPAEVTMASGSGPAVVAMPDDRFVVIY